MVNQTLIKAAKIIYSILLKKCCAVLLSSGIIDGGAIPLIFFSGKETRFPNFFSKFLPLCLKAFKLFSPTARLHLSVAKFHYQFVLM